MMTLDRAALAVALAPLLLSFGCSSSADATMPSSNEPLVAGPQTPPQKAADVETWLAGGAYKSWHCESAVHEARRPSPHGKNRICSNDLASSFASGAERPRGTAAVKELYDDAGAKIVGYAVYLKTEATSAGGSNWYWYERVPLDSMAPHDAKGVVADGFGSAGTAKSICVGCHAAAGSDAMHTPSAGSSDQVYTQVK